MSTQNWTTDNLPDLTGQISIITGANSGIGFEAAKVLARQNGTVIMACRNLVKAEAALNALKQAHPGADARVMQLDLASQKSVHTFAEAFLADNSQLDLLINNAGIMAVPYATTEDGFESQLGVNHLGHFALTGLLIDPLLKTEGSRIVNISSMAHTAGQVDFENLMYAEGQGYSPFKAYSRSKLANLLFTYALQRRLAATEASTIAVAAHPGGSNTNLGGHFNKWYHKGLMAVFSVLMQSAEMGALPTLRAALDPAAESGDYYGPGGFREMRGYPIKVDSSSTSHQTTDQRKLWDVSQHLTGISYL